MSTATPYIDMGTAPGNEYTLAWALSISDRVRALAGKANNVTNVTLTANAATTVLKDPRLYVNSYIGFMPQTANAASAGASIYVDSQTKGSATIHHANDANLDKTYTLVIAG